MKTTLKIFFALTIILICIFIAYPLGLLIFLAFNAIIHAIKHSRTGKQFIKTNPSLSTHYSICSIKWSTTALITLGGTILTRNWPDYLWPALALALYLATYQNTRIKEQ